MLVRETFVNVDRNIRFAENAEETDLTPGEVFRNCRREYGRCVSRMYREGNGRPDYPVGWVFQKRDRYEDSGETYLREVWVECVPARGE